MSDDLFASSPMGGSQAPYKEMNPDVQPVGQSQQATSPTTPQASTPQTPKKNKQKKILLIGGGIFAGFIVLLLIIILVILATREPQQVFVVKETPAPSPTPAPDNSGLPQNITDQVVQLNEDIENTDLQELEMIYPRLNWEIEY